MGSNRPRKRVRATINSYSRCCHYCSQTVLPSLDGMAETTGLEPTTSAVTVMLTDCKQRTSWVQMAKSSTLEHAKTLGKSNISVFSTLAGTLRVCQRRSPRPLPLLYFDLLLGLPSKEVRRPNHGVFPIQAISRKSVLLGRIGKPLPTFGDRSGQ